MEKYNVVKMETKSLEQTLEILKSNLIHKQNELINFVAYRIVYKECFSSLHFGNVIDNYYYVIDTINRDESLNENYINYYISLLGSEDIIKCNLLKIQILNIKNEINKIKIKIEECIRFNECGL